MPRTGGVFSLLSGSKGVPNTTIQSAPYNAQLDDFVQDANLARPITAGGTGATNPTQARTNLGLAIGSDVQGYDAGLKSIADMVTVADQIPYTTAPDAYATTALTAYARSLLDDNDASAARLTLGLKALAILDNINNSNWSGEDLAVANGGTGASTASSALSNLGFSPFFKTLIDDATGADVFWDMGGTSSFSTFGYQKLPSGLIIQWGSLGLGVVGGFNPQSINGWNWYTTFYQINLPIAFPTAGYAVSIANSGYTFASQGSMAGVTCNARLSSLSQIEVSVVAPQTGNFPAISFIAVGI